ncbi:PmoA family protein [Halalkalibaculum sp. DA384]|uniref:DUF6807 domain-containing protein n=1 Tax=Halalkalibaculum sp. DA384 TaxID=3373606 RepID=UPI0037551C9D
MKNRKTFLLLLLVFVSPSLVFGVGPQNTGDNQLEGHLSWEIHNDALQLLIDGEVLWKLVYTQRVPNKPYFSVLRTVEGYDVASLVPPDDRHPWHRGLWFSWKEINGTNYWNWNKNSDEWMPPGRVRVHDIQATLNNDFSATVDFFLVYAPKEGGAVLREDRTLHISAPDENGDYTIDWEMVFTAEKDLVFDRTKPLHEGGVSWGGYAGLIYRAAYPGLTGFRFYDSNGNTITEPKMGYGKKAKWMGVRAEVKQVPGQQVGLTIFDHPQNPRYPSPWSIYFEDDKGAQHHPALLYNKPLELKAGESLKLKYRVLVHSGEKGKNELENEYSEYINQ